MLSLTCKTAIKSVLYLASKHKTNLKCSLKEVAEYINASEHSVGKILQTLVKNKIINSSKGPTGGFFIDDKKLNLPIIKIIEAIDGPQVFKGCGLGLAQCSAQRPCPIHHDYKKIRDEFEKLCYEKTIKDLGSPVEEGLAYLIA